ncbi:hypothetical protein FIV42_15530 [Persicimonas caeni]|uniref:ScoMcrA-like DNA sulfur-binding domain-containing protein n=1 Tax=Persicimonas caeni TaxID=2292766 RepID=A0A4Y6PUV2_PERCE|nr:hypothetical protein [Persicimonas caeni]QDG52102.1 hypothetical protein FIV42_15530 [Persicimonas caeni]QED33323.1 hypothetical protein FRD00_15525 [Persicimonas caeni]
MNVNDRRNIPSSFFEKHPIMRWAALTEQLAGRDDIGEPIHDPAQAVFVLLLVARACRYKPGSMRFEEHATQLQTVLERFSKPIGGESAPNYPFWRFQEHGFWRLEPNADGKVVGVCEERLWQALIQHPWMRYDLAKSLLDAYWPEEIHATIRNAIALPEGPPPRQT